MSVTNGVKCFKKHRILQNLDYLSYKFLTPSNQVLTLCTKNATETHNTKSDFVKKIYNKAVFE